jgi:hypothetical protein
MGTLDTSNSEAYNRYLTQGRKVAIGVAVPAQRFNGRLNHADTISTMLNQQRYCHPAHAASKLIRYDKKTPSLVDLRCWGALSVFAGKLHVTSSLTPQ